MNKSALESLAALLPLRLRLRSNRYYHTLWHGKHGADPTVIFLYLRNNGFSFEVNFFWADLKSIVVNYLSLPWTYLKEPLHEKADACHALVNFDRPARFGWAAD